MDPMEIQEYLGEFKPHTTSDKMKEELNKQVMEDNILKAITDMKPNTSPGPDGYTAIF